MKLVKTQIQLNELEAMASKSMFNLVKVVVDIDKEIMVVDAEMHADEEQYLLALGSKQRNLWGINLYPKKYGSKEFIEFDSMINLRPNENNLSRGIDNEIIKKKIETIVKKLVVKNV